MISLIKKRIFAFALLILGMSYSFADTLFSYEENVAIQNVMGRDRISLNGRWNVLPDVYGVGLQQKWYKDISLMDPKRMNQVVYDECQTLEVPGDWNHQDARYYYFEGDMWYQKSFKKPSLINQRLFLHFAAVANVCDVYLNGKLLGSHKGGFTPFQFEITDSLKDENNVVVRADNRRSVDGIPAMRFDWWNYGGITRDVDLVIVPNTYVYDYKVQLSKDSFDEISAKIKIKGDKVNNMQAFVEIPELKIKKSIVTDANGEGEISFKANKIQLWNTEAPKLYSVKISCGKNKVEDEIGFRCVQVKGNRILLNGKEVFLKGINIHEEISSQERRATNAADANFLLDHAKALGCNFIRLSHYSHNEYMVKMAEKRGFLMWEEVPIWQRINFKNPDVCKLGERMMHEMIARDKNRCGIILWSISNETFYSDERLNFLAKLADETRSHDNTRLVTSALHMSKARKLQNGKYEMFLDDPLIKHLDVIGNNKYLGWYEPFATNPENLSWNISIDKPLIMSEFGAECVSGNYKGDPENINSWNEEYMADVFVKDFKSFVNAPNLAGTSPWILFDFRSPQRSHALFQHGWNRKGLISPNGGLKKAWHVVHDFYNKCNK